MRAGYTQVEAAARLGWSFDTYRRTEYGRNMTILRIKRIAEALGCDVREIVDVD